MVHSALKPWGAGPRLPDLLCTLCVAFFCSLDRRLGDPKIKIACPKRGTAPLPEMMAQTVAKQRKAR